MRNIALMFVLIFSSTYVSAQQNDTLLNKLDSLDKVKPVQGQVNNTNPAAYNANTRITFTDYFVLSGSDLKQSVTAPFHQTGKHWKQIGIYAASLTALSLIADEPVQRNALHFYNNNKTVESISNHITKFGGRYEIYSLAALGGYGFIFNNKKLQTTTLLATQSYITAGLIETAVKHIANRQRPAYFSRTQTEAEPTFHGPFFKGDRDVNGKKFDPSFPSGHTTVIFAAATVFAKEYKNIPWVPVAAYSAASLVGLSRLTENKHWLTDVLAGATLGYLCGTKVVNNYHRYAAIKSRYKSGTISFNINYNGNNFEPGFTYTFK